MFNGKNLNIKPVTLDPNKKQEYYLYDCGPTGDAILSSEGYKLSALKDKLIIMDGNTIGTFEGLCYTVCSNNIERKGILKQYINPSILKLRKSSVVLKNIIQTTTSISSRLYNVFDIINEKKIKVSDIILDISEIFDSIKSSDNKYNLLDLYKNHYLIYINSLYFKIMGIYYSINLNASKKFIIKKLFYLTLDNQYDGVFEKTCYDNYKFVDVLDIPNIGKISIKDVSVY